MSWRDTKHENHPWYVKQIRNLWPSHDWNDDMLRAFSEAFRSENSETLRTAIQLTREKGRAWRVEIAWIKDMIRELESNRAGRSSREDRARAADERREAVEAEARECEDEHRLRVRDLMEMDDRDLRSLVESTRESFLSLRIIGRPTEWSRLSAGLVHANGVALGLLSTLHLAPSHDQEPSCETERSASTAPTKQVSSDSPLEAACGTLEATTPAQSKDQSDAWFSSI